MKESILHYVWQYKLFSAHNLQTTDGESIELIDVGKNNSDAGPDFFNAKIKINKTLWAGNVEIHRKSSDWFKHLHQEDKAYDSVILHVVLKADCDIFRSNGTKIPQLELVFPKQIAQNYEELVLEKKNIACFNKIADIPPIFIQSWKNALLIERLADKTKCIEQFLEDNKGHWEESFYWVLARNFGFSTNSEAFERLAKSLPLNILAKHKNNLFQIEALLFGQSGLLLLAPIDEYSESLKKEYLFLSSKYKLKTNLSPENWKLLRLRPGNFPHLRIAQFAALIHSSTKLFSRIIEKPQVKNLQTLFNCEPSLYWETHYRFSKEEGQKRKKKIGLQAINTIIINSVVPSLFTYARRQDNKELQETALAITEQLPPEKNKITAEWEKLGFQNLSAYDSQALLQLWNKYCDEKKCLRCRIGHKVLNKKI